MKTCTKCKVDQEVTSFYKNKNLKDGRAGVCKLCMKQNEKKWMVKNKDKKLQQNRDWAINNPDKVKQYRKNTYALHKDEMLKRNKEYRLKNGKTYNQTRWERIKSDPSKRAMHNLRGRFHSLLRNTKKVDSSNALIGCSLNELKLHLETQFIDDMSWDNYGQDGWHIDHIRPIDSYDLTIESQQRECFHYSNLQPLWANDNYSKGSKY
jgi:hypothetical protein